MTQTATQTPTAFGEIMSLVPTTDTQAADVPESTPESSQESARGSRLGLLRRKAAEPEQPANDPYLEDLCLVDHESGRELAHDTEHLEADDLFAGNVLTFKDHAGKHNYVIQEVQGVVPGPKRGPAREEDDQPRGPVTVRLNPARSNMHKSLLLLAILAGTWFLVSWLLKLIF